MIFRDQIKTCPIAHEPDLGIEAAQRLGLTSGALFELVKGVAGSSPYLRGLLEKEAAFAASIWDANPDDLLAQVLDFDVTDDIATTLRRVKRQVALLTALCDLSGAWQLSQVTRALTLLADRAVHVTLKHLVAQFIERGKIPQAAGIDPDKCAGIFVLAMGKMGAYELNYSSDIDLICLFDDSYYEVQDLAELRPHFIRIIQQMCKILSDVTKDGYVFRTDLRLRPNPSVTPVCISTTAAEKYYETEGRTWERGAFIKARSCAGDIAAGQAFLQTLTPFIWRRHLDFAAIQDAHDMRLRIREHKGLGGATVIQGHNIKLGRGGIREIEFFAQTLQMIAGGRDDSLRSNKTLQALRDLAAADWITLPVCKALSAAYIAHRDHEHRIQMIGDLQTHDYPKTDAGFLQFSRLAGQGDAQALTQEIEARLDAVHETIDAFFANEAEPLEQGSSEFDPVFEQWESLPAFRTSRAVELFASLKPQLVQQFSGSDNPDEAIANFEQFLAGLPAGIQVFSLFQTNPQILDLVLDIVTTAPPLARYLARNAHVLDAVITGTFFEAVPDMDALVLELRGVLAPIEDYEDALNETRRWFKEYHFRIGVLQLREIVDAFEASQSYSDLAQACLQVFVPIVQREFAKKHGAIAGQGLAVLALGKLGSCDMTASSDIDMIVIYDRGDDTPSDGARALYPVQYFARLTQMLVTALSSPTAEGKLYEVDMRLRPSGRKGPVATSLRGFIDYQRTQAWTWEHLALTRARVVAGSDAMGQHVMETRREIITQPRDRGTTLQDISDMRQRLAKAKPKATTIWDIKEAPGGLLDIELLAQGLALLGGCTEMDPKAQLAQAAQNDLIPSDAALVLIKTHRLLGTIQHIGRLLVHGVFDIAKIGQAGMAHILSATGFKNRKALEETLNLKIRQSEQIIVSYLKAN